MLDVQFIMTLLQAQGIPVIGVVNVDNTIANASIQYDPSATQAQITQGNAILAAFDPTSRLGYVDCTKTGATPVLLINGAADLFFPLMYRVIVRSASGVTLSPTISLGTNSPNYNNVVAATQLSTIGLNNAGDMRNVWLTTTQVVTQNVIVFANVQIAALATAYRIRFDFKGDYEPIP